MGTKHSINQQNQNQKEIIKEPLEINTNRLDEFKLESISDEDYKDVEEKITKMTGFKPYYAMEVKLNKEQKPIDGTYYQFNKGCICYTLINNGWIDEQYIPDSMKYYKNHNYKEDKRDDTDFLRRCISIIDLSQLWVNVGGDVPFWEIDLDEVRRKVYLVLKDYFNEPKTPTMQLVGAMTRQNKDYFYSIGNAPVKFIPLRDKINDNPCLKNAIDLGIVQKRDIVKFGRHCFIFDEVFEEDSKKFYSFHDSLSYFFPAKKPEYENVVCNKKKGFIFAREDAKLININNDDEYDIGIVYVIANN